MRARGFTLIETLVAMVVAGIAAAVILAMVRGLMQRAEQEQRLIADAVGVLNESALFGAFHPYVQPREQRDPESLLLTPLQTELPAVLVRNFAVREEKLLPPLAVAFTPFQSYSLQRGSQAITRIAPALPVADAVMPGTAAAAEALGGGMAGAGATR